MRIQILNDTTIPTPAYHYGLDADYDGYDFYGQFWLMTILGGKNNLFIWT